MGIENYLSKFRKRIQFNYSGQSLVFDVSQSLFSSANVDKGTFQLIGSLRKNSGICYERILDLGCGYGPIGVFLKKAHPDSEVHCADRDALALEFARHNAELNSCKIDFYPSLDYQNVRGKFSLICCNYPAKAGLNAFKRFVYDASGHLVNGGIFAVVIVKELLADFESILVDEIEILHRQKSAGHFVFHLRFRKKICFGEDPYLRNRVDYVLGSKSYALKTAYTIPEFESPGFVTKAIIGVVEELPKGLRIFAVDPFQGHLAVAVCHYAEPKELALVSRDLLSLEYSKDNLVKNGFKKINLVHKVMVDDEAGDLLVWRLSDDLEFVQFKKEFGKIRNNFGRVILAGARPKLRQLIGLLKLSPLIEKEEHNAAAVLVEAGN